ncbi:hypothetical protein LTR78_010427 [Recurvomyces mirabilis]|uniref:DUF1857-domain-containing protein n=1 Tax=Recurvomyces mirabilis TaxID=574656 RepID=A0AAE0TLT0_9PEZI|nr:hypothetical protein LTR78_010427 [Recurvomyces mirabilis]KAK5150505.1 hypothetical protein LTS14_009998 [Recurvomyces mirabilis]
MVNIHCAYSEQINPSSSSLTLTRNQIWKGLQRKIRNAQDFVPVIDKTEVVEDKDGVVTRITYYDTKEDQPGHTVKEVCKEYHPTKVDFHQPNGTLITNTISDGPSLKDEGLCMTYTFEWQYPKVEDGSDEHKKLIAEHVQMAKDAVQSSIEAMRKMAKAGELGQ